MKLYTLTFKLSIDSLLEETYTIDIPAANEIQARDRFLTGINQTQLFVINGICWPMFYTRAVILKCILSGSKESPVKSAESTQLFHPSVYTEEKKVRKPRAPKSKVVEPVQGIKPNKRGRKPKAK